MEAKYQQYKTYNWSDCEPWQIYLNNIYPIPPRDKLLQIRKKWYRTNIDKEFDITYEPPSEEQQQQNQNRPQGAQNQGPQGAFRPNNPQFNHYMQPDKLPHLQQYQNLCWLIFFLTLPLRLYTNYFAFGALLLGVMKKNGKPQFNKEFLQQVMFDENFQGLGYMGVVAMIGTVNFILYIPLLLMAYVELAPVGKNILERNPNAFVLSWFKSQINQGVQYKGEFIMLRSDIEVYIGIYLIIVWFFGWSHLLSIIIYWQLIRLKFHINYNTQNSFRKLDVKILQFTNSPRCPGLVTTAYNQIKSFMLWMGTLEQPQGGAPAAGIGRRCVIF